MTKAERQLTLETRMYRNKTFGKMPICKHCFACAFTHCISSSKSRMIGGLCAEAEARMIGRPRCKNQPNKKYKPKCGLKDTD